MQDQLAIIDLGTNTFHLLIAEKQGARYRIVYREKQAVRIGVGGINRNVITDEALSRATGMISKFKSTMESRQVTRVFAFGTSALRNADNRSEVIERIKAETGIDVSILSGDQEAEFIYYGIRSAFDLGTTPSMIMDIGGGSVEFIIGNREKILWKRSYEIGGQRLLEKFQHHDPIAHDEIVSLNKYFENSLSDLFDHLNLHQPETMVGSSGTFDTLSDIFCLRNEIHKHEDDPETPLSREGFYEIYNELVAKNRAQRMAIPGMIEMRVDMIVVACCLIRYVLDKYRFKKIRVSGYSLKEGALYYLGEKLN